MKTSKLLASLIVSLGLAVSFQAISAPSMADQAAAIYRDNSATVMRNKSPNGVPSQVDSQVRNYIINTFGVGTPEQYGDYTQRVIWNASYMGKNIIPGKYNDYSYYKYYINTTSVRKSANGTNRGRSTNHSIELDVIMKKNSNEINEYKWTSQNH
jgi:hypothetical protein